jgi:hypothetical protein
MVNLLLFLISVSLFSVSLVLTVLYTIYDSVSELLGKVALALDMAGNVLLARPFNHFLIKDSGYKFGNRKETISSVLGKNKRDGTLTTLGKGLCSILDFIDENHCIKSIDNIV